MEAKKRDVGGLRMKLDEKGDWWISIALAHWWLSQRDAWLSYGYGWLKQEDCG